MDSQQQDEYVEQVWRDYLLTGDSQKDHLLHMVDKALPGSPRCKHCYAPFKGPGSYIARLLQGTRPSNMNPHLCNTCEVFARKYQGGTEIELSLLFADVRGSVALAESMSPKAFSKLIDRFYQTTTRVMAQSDALIDKITGDQIAGMFVPGFAGPNHARQAILAAQEIMRATGHGSAEGPWIRLGAGVHTDIAYVGAVGSEEGTIDITVLGDAANTAARLCTEARIGEILISEVALQAAEMPAESLQKRSLDLKGKTTATVVYILADF